MIFHDDYAQVPPAEVDRFVASQELGRLNTVGADGTPHVGLYPFVRQGAVVDLHLVREDELTVDLEARPRCVFEVDEVLGVIPSYWGHAEYAGSATAYHRTVIFECRATVLEDPRPLPRSRCGCSRATSPRAASARWTPTIPSTGVRSGGWRQCGWMSSARA